MAAESIPIPVLINPNYAHAQPVVHQIDQGFTAYAKKWRIKPVLREGDALRHTRSAVQAGAEMVVCYGGDKILREVVQGVYGSPVPIGYIPENFDPILGQRLESPATLVRRSRFSARATATRRCAPGW